MVKVCGLTREGDVALASALGAWGLGFVFADSPRRVTVERCRRLVAARDEALGGGGHADHGRRPLAIGVFAGQSLSLVGEIASRAGLDAVQLHERGDWVPLAAGTGWAELPPGVGVLPVVPVDVAAVPCEAVAADVAVAATVSPVVLLDARANGRAGGTGRCFDWTLLEEIGRGCRSAVEGETSDGTGESADGRIGAPLLLLAGGIAPGNVSRALRLPGVSGIDVSSGVEASPGVKDHGRLRALFAAVDGRSVPAP